MADIIDIGQYRLRTCSNCRFHNPNGNCERPGGYDFDIKAFICRSFQWSAEARKKIGGNHETD